MSWSQKAVDLVCEVIDELKNPNPSLTNRNTLDTESGANDTSHEDGEENRKKRARGSKWMRTFLLWLLVFASLG